MQEATPPSAHHSALATDDDVLLHNTVGLSTVYLGDGRQLLWIGESHDEVVDSSSTRNVVSILKDIVAACGDRTVDVFVEQNETHHVMRALKGVALVGDSEEGGQMMNMVLGHLKRMDSRADYVDVTEGHTDCRNVRLQLSDPRNLGVYAMIDHFKATFIEVMNGGSTFDAEDLKQEIGIVHQIGVGEVLMVAHLCLRLLSSVKKKKAAAFVRAMVSRYISKWMVLAGGAVGDAVGALHNSPEDGSLQNGKDYIDAMNEMCDAMDRGLELYILARAAASDADYLIAYTGDTHRARWNDVAWNPRVTWGFKELRSQDTSAPLTAGEVHAALHDNSSARARRRRTWAV